MIFGAVSLFLITPWAMAVLLLIFTGFTVPNIFRRHFLSKGAVLYITVFLAPLAACISIGTALLALVGDTPVWQKLLIIVGCAALFLMAAAVYARGHFYPTDKSADYGGNEKIIGARRLMLIGIPGVFLYTAFAFVVLLDFLGIISPWFDNTPSEFISNIGAMLFCLLIPLINLIVLAYFLILGSELAIFATALSAAFLFSLLITNGCIRYILTENRGKTEKGLFIFLSLFPAINFIMGIRYCVKISKILKTKKGA